MRSCYRRHSENRHPGDEDREDDPYHQGHRDLKLIELTPQTTCRRIMWGVVACLILGVLAEISSFSGEGHALSSFYSSSSSSLTVKESLVTPRPGNHTSPKPNSSQGTFAGTDDDWSDPNKKFFVYKFASFGLGSQMMALFAKMIYFDQDFNRSIIAVETYYGYRRNETHGVLSGYFTPRFPVLDQLHQHARVDEVLLQQEQGASPNTSLESTTIPPRHPSWTLATFQPIVGKESGPAWRGTLDEHERVWLTSLWDHRKEIKARYNTSALSFYQLMVKYMCPHMSWNEETRLEIRQAQQHWNLPMDWDVGPTVAFHIRRTDKVAGKQIESKSYNGTAYVNKLLEACYVATDEVTAVQEITTALQVARISCPVYALCTRTQDPGSRTSPSDTLVLMTEVSILSETTYFVGTFNSNLGAWVSVLRSCQAGDAGGESSSSPPSGEEKRQGSKAPHSADSLSRPAKHYAQSYGVDRDAWFWF